jgi:hypothetical protein
MTKKRLFLILLLIAYQVISGGLVAMNLTSKKLDCAEKVVFCNNMCLGCDKRRVLISGIIVVPKKKYRVVLRNTVLLDSTNVCKRHWFCEECYEEYIKNISNCDEKFSCHTNSRLCYSGCYQLLDFSKLSLFDYDKFKTCNKRGVVMIGDSQSELKKMNENCELGELLKKIGWTILHTGHPLSYCFGNLLGKILERIKKEIKLGYVIYENSRQKKIDEELFEKNMERYVIEESKKYIDNKRVKVEEEEEEEDLD